MASDWRSRAEPLDAPAPKANWRSRAEPLTAEDLNAQVDAAAAVEAGRRNVEAEQAMEARRQAAADAYRPVGPQALPKTVAHKALQGATANWSDRLMAAIARKHELVDPANAHYRMPDGTMRKVESSDELGTAVRDDERQTLNAMDDQHPVAAPLSQLGGALGMQSAMATAGLPVFGTPGQVVLGGIEGVGQTEHDLDTPEGAVEALVRGGGNAALGGVLGRMGSRGGRKLAEAEGTIDRLLGPVRGKIAAEGAEAERKASDLALKAVHADHAKDVKAIDGMRAKIQDRILRDYEKAATASGMSPEQAAKMLTANEQQIQDQIEAEYRKALYGDYAKANKAGVRAVRDVKTVGAAAKPEHANTLKHFEDVLQQNVDETLAKGVPQPPVKMTREEMLAEVARRMNAAKAKGVKAVRTKHGTPPVMPREELEALTESRIKALQDSGRLPSGADLSDDEIEGLTAMKLGDPRFLESKNPALARKIAAGTPPVPPDEALAEGLSDKASHLSTLADMLPSSGLKGRAAKSVLRALGGQSDRAAYDAADEIRKSVVMRLLAKYGPAATGSIRELDSQAADKLADEHRRKLGAK